MPLEFSVFQGLLQENIYAFCGILYALVLLRIVAHFHSQLASQRRINVLQQKQNRELTRDIRILLECGTGLGRRVDEQQELINAVIHRQDKLDIEKPGDTNYKQAMALMETGLSNEDMLSVCELSQGEINIISQLKKAHQNRQIPAHS